MAEIFFVLITIYAAYVISTVINGNKKNQPEEKISEPEKAVTEQAVTKTEAVVTEVVKKPAEKKTIVKKPAAKKVASTKTKASGAKSKPKAKAAAKKPKESLPAGSIRNPETGEVAKIASQYRMTKRWIKEALVAEGLLDKIYKTSEIDDKAKVKIDKALQKLVALEKYQ